MDIVKKMGKEALCAPTHGTADCARRLRHAQLCRGSGHSTPERRRDHTCCVCTCEEWVRLCVVPDACAEQRKRASASSYRPLTAGVLARAGPRSRALSSRSGSQRPAATSPGVRRAPCWPRSRSRPTTSALPRTPPPAAVPTRHSDPTAAPCTSACGVRLERLTQHPGRASLAAKTTRW